MTDRNKQIAIKEFNNIQILSAQNLILSLKRCIINTIKNNSRWIRAATIFKSVPYPTGDRQVGRRFPRANVCKPLATRHSPLAVHQPGSSLSCRQFEDSHGLPRREPTVHFVAFPAELCRVLPPFLGAPFAVPRSDMPRPAVVNLVAHSSHRCRSPYSAAIFCAATLRPLPLAGGAYHT